MAGTVLAQQRSNWKEWKVWGEAVELRLRTGDRALHQHDLRETQRDVELTAYHQNIYENFNQATQNDYENNSIKIKEEINQLDDPIKG